MTANQGLFHFKEKAQKLYGAEKLQPGLRGQVRIALSLFFSQSLTAYHKDPIQFNTVGYKTLHHFESNYCKREVTK